MKQKTRSMIPFFVIMFIFNMAANFVHPVTPTIILDLGLNDYMFGLALAAMMSCNFLFSPFWGKMASYISSKAVMLICGICYAVGQIFFAFSQTELQFLLARMFAGAFCGGSYVAFMTYTVNCSTEETRGRNLAINATATVVSSSFGYFVGGMVGELNVYYSVWLQIFTLTATSIVFYFLCQEDKQSDLSRLSGKVLVHECNPFSAIMQCRRFMTKLLIYLFVAYGLANLGYTAFEQCFNYYLRDQFGLTSGYNGVIKAALGVISLVANSTLCMWILRRKQTSPYLIGVMSVCAISMLGVIVCESVIPFIAVNVIFFAFYFISLPLAQNCAAILGRGRDSNLVMASFNAVKSFGGIFGSAFAGLIYEIHAKLPFSFGFAAFLVATLLMVLFRREEKKTA